MYIKILLDCDWLISVQLIPNTSGSAIFCSHSAIFCNYSAKICNKLILIGGKNCDDKTNNMIYDIMRYNKVRKTLPVESS